MDNFSKDLQIKLEPKSFLTDFEIGCINAFDYVYPGAENWLLFPFCPVFVEAHPEVPRYLGKVQGHHRPGLRFASSPISCTRLRANSVFAIFLGYSDGDPFLQKQRIATPTPH